MLLTRVWRDTGWCLTNRPVFLSTIENSNFKPTFLLVFNSSPPPSPNSKSRENLHVQRKLSAVCRNLLLLHSFCLLTYHFYFNFWTKSWESAPLRSSGRWQQMDTVFPPQIFLYVDAKKEIQPSHIFPIITANSRKCFLCVQHNSITFRSWVWGNLLFIKNLFAP